MARRGWMLLGTVCFAACNLTCGNPLDLCGPQQANLRFFSKGDCVVTRATFFSGHEWITFFGNRDLPIERRFAESEIDAIIEGNRRVDWPQELLVHLNSSVVDYLNALIEHTDRPEIQASHFLLDDTNTSAEAAAEAYLKIESLTREAVRNWNTDRVGALTSIGQALHSIQDSFSPAHTVRDPAQDWCIESVKAFITRQEGFLTPDIQFHGQGGEDDDSNIGHTTVEDSIYREGRDCNDPANSEEVENCLDEFATRGRLGTRDYLDMMQDLVRTNASDEVIGRRFQQYVQAHLRLCS